MADREEGYYWVRTRCDGDWIVAEWAAGAWLVPGFECTRFDTSLQEIDERRLERGTE